MFRKCSSASTTEFAHSSKPVQSLCRRRGVSIPEMPEALAECPCYDNPPLCRLPSVAMCAALQPPPSDCLSDSQETEQPKLQPAWIPLSLWTQKFLERGVPRWHRKFRIQHCHCSGSGHCCGMGSVPGPGISACCRCSQKGKKR